MSQQLKACGLAVNLLTKLWEIQELATHKTLLLLDEADYFLFEVID